MRIARRLPQKRRDVPADLGYGKCRTCGERMLPSGRPGYVFCPRGHGDRYDRKADQEADARFWRDLDESPRHHHA